MDRFKTTPNLNTNSNFITEELVSFCDTDKILSDIEQIFSDPEFDKKLWNEYHQIALHEGATWFDGIGSLYDYENNTWKNSTANFNKTSYKLNGTYLAEVIQQVRDYVLAQSNVKIGRIRIMNIPFKTCYSLHMDLEEFRYHIPIKTNHSAFFVVGNKIDNMPNVGSLYKFKTDDWHTAVNAGLEDRWHILFDTYRD